jgi:hypothetical protein
MKKQNGILEKAINFARRRLNAGKAQRLVGYRNDLLQWKKKGFSNAFIAETLSKGGFVVCSTTVRQACGSSKRKLSQVATLGNAKTTPLPHSGNGATELADDDDESVPF